MGRHTASEVRVASGSVQMARTLGQHEREEAARQYYPMAIALAKLRHKKLPASSIQVVDMISAAGEGLARALHTYNSSIGTPLGSWVAFRVHSQITDDLRSLDLLPQQKRAMVKQVYDVRDALEKRLHRHPTLADIAAFLGWPAELVETIMQMGNITIDFIDMAQAPPLPDRRDPVAQVERDQREQHLEECLTTLDIEGRVAFRMRRHGASLEGVATVLDMSIANAQRRVSKGQLTLTQCMQAKGWHDA